MAELLFFLEAFVVSFLLTGGILRFSLERRLLDIPNFRSSHSVPKPRLGGVAITVSFYVAAATLLLAGFRPFASPAILAGALGGGAVIALSGLYDDLRGLDARVKLLVQFGAAGIAVASGIVLHDFSVPLMGTLHLGGFAVPATLVWIVAIVNFYNFVDGIDGLAAGIGLIASAFLYYISGMAGIAGLQSVYAVLAGSSFGFLRFNFPPARIFMGDTGSTFIGYTFAVLSVVGQGAGIPAFLTVLLLAGVIGDAVLTLVRRAVRKERLFSPHRTHYYQRLTTLGLSHKQVTLLEYLVAALLGVSAILAYHQTWSFVSFLSVIWIGFFLWALAKIRSMEQGRRLLWEGRTLGVAFGDLAFIALSYALSYYLRLNFKFPQAETQSMLISLPIVLVIRTAVFYSYGLYRGIWRYTTFDDVIRIGKAVSVGSAIMVVSFTLLFRFKAFPRSVFIIDWFILTVFMAGSRIATRWFHELPSREEITGQRVIIAGSGPLAELVLREVRKSGERIPVGYLDDRTEMTGRLLSGLKVLGPVARAEEIAKANRVDEILALPSFLDRIPRDARERLAASGVRLRTIMDPAEAASGDVERIAEPPCADRNVLVAGNGSLVDASLLVFSRARELVVASNDDRALEETLRRAGAQEPRARRYLGVLDDPRSLRGILDALAPDLVFADFRLRDAGVENALEAFARMVFRPLETVAAEVAKRPPSRLVVFERCAGPAAADDVGATELLLIDVFRRDPSRCVVLRIDGELGPCEWASLAALAAEADGGIYRAVRAPGTESALVALEIGEAFPDAARLRLAVARSLDDGDAPALAAAIEEMARVSPVREHAS